MASSRVAESGGGRSRVDVVTVPDFDGARRDSFEARTLLFLACWSEFGGHARSFPLHVACIGEPPPSVRWLAARCHAELHVFPPLLLGTFRGLNKLRGFEVPARTGRLLVVDTDVLVLSDFSDVATIADGIAASPAVKARVPERHWKRIYADLAVPVPTDRLASLVGRLNTGDFEHPAYPEQNSESRSMLPYYNSGVVLVPCDSDLRERWQAYAERIYALFEPDVEQSRAVHRSDQAGLSAAIVALGREGTRFTTLPDRLHASWPHLYRRAPSLADVALFHAFGLFGKARRANGSVSSSIDDYCYQVARRLVTTWRRDPEGPLRPATFRRNLGPAALDVVRLRRKLHQAHRQHVLPALAAAAR